MRRNKIELYLHIVWATWNREPWIMEGMQRRLYRAIENEAKKCGCRVFAINGIADHVHMLLSFPTTITIAKLLKQMKGPSSHFINEEFKPNIQFKWQGGYGAFTVSPWHTEEIKEYIRQQKEHHSANTLQKYLEEIWIDD